MKKFLRLLPETRLDLTAGIYTTFVLAVQRIVLEIVKSYSWIIWCDKNLKRKQEKNMFIYLKTFRDVKAYRTERCFKIVMMASENNDYIAST